MPRPVPTNSHSYVERVKNRRRKKYGTVKRFYDFHDGVEKTPPTGIYRGGLVDTDFTGLDNKVKQAFSLNNASTPEIQKARLEAFKHRFGNGIYDTGSAAMQAATFCEKTLSAIRHVQGNNNDSYAVQRLVHLLVRRRKALEYLKSKDFSKYSEMIHYYKVKDVASGMHKGNFHVKHANRA